MNIDTKEIIVFTDGSSRGNPGRAGYGIVVYFPAEGKVVEQGGHESRATNNQMEIRAVIEALRMLKSDINDIVIYTDSSYVLNGATKWIYGWEKNGWKTATKSDVENKELWQELAQASRAIKGKVRWEKTDGHSGVFGNELADMIATKYADGEKVLLFKGTKKAHEVYREGDILRMEKSTTAVKKKSSKKDTRPPYSYVSMINGVVLTHKTWNECEARVKGKNAKFKKVFSKEEEQLLIQEWTLSTLLGA